MALPGVFKPVTIDGRVLIDGGTVSPVPYDVLSPGCDIVIAIDVIGQRSRPAGRSANYFDTVFLATKVMQTSIMTEKRKVLEPDIYVAPRVTDVRALEFHRAEAIFEHAEPSKEVLRNALQKALAAYSASKRQ
jgi:NTE family protein